MPWDEVDRLLVFGEAVTSPKTGCVATKFPSLADLGARYGVSRNRVWQYASRARCFQRREEARLKTQERYEQKVVERVAEARALATNVVRLRPRSAGCSGLPPPSSRESSAKRRPRPCGVVETTICYIASAG